MDEMKEWELYDILDNIDITKRDEWEQSRLVAFWAARPHYKRLSINQVMTFPWEDDGNSSDNILNGNIKVDNNDIKELNKLFIGMN